MLATTTLPRLLRLALLASATFAALTTARPGGTTEPFKWPDTDSTHSSYHYRSSGNPSTPSKWETELASIPYGPRQDHSVTALGLEVLIVGGLSPPSSSDPHDFSSSRTTKIPSLRYVQAYAPLTDSWRRLADLPTPLNHANIGVVHGKLYALGGLTGDGIMMPSGDSYKYTPFTNSWEKIPDMPLTVRRGAGAVGVWKDMVIVAGGLKHMNPFTGAETTSRHVSAYNTLTKAWVSYPELPDAGRDHAGAVVWNSTMYVIGGRVNGVRNVKGDVWAMNLRQPEAGWSRKRDMPTPRGGLSVVLLNDKIYTFGGEGRGSASGSSGSGSSSGMFANVEVYDPELDTWEVLEDMPSPRHGAGAAVVLGEVYIPGGSKVTGRGATDGTQGFVPTS